MVHSASATSSAVSNVSCGRVRNSSSFCDSLGRCQRHAHAETPCCSRWQGRLDSVAGMLDLVLKLTYGVTGQLSRLNARSSTLARSFCVAATSSWSSRAFSSARLVEYSAVSLYLSGSSAVGLAGFSNCSSVSSMASSFIVAYRAATGLSVTSAYVRPWLVIGMTMGLSRRLDPVRRARFPRAPLSALSLPVAHAPGVTANRPARTSSASVV